MVMRNVSLALLCAWLVQITNANTIGRTFLGYTFLSDVEGYLSVSTDVCTIRTNIEKTPPDYTTSQAIYMNGLASPKKLRDFTTTDYSTEHYGKLFSMYYSSATYLDDYVMHAFYGDAPLTTDGQRRQVIRKTMQYAVLVAYMFHELDSALKKVRVKDVNITTGAPHAVDEAYALYAGENALCTPYGNAEFYSSLFGTRHDCQYSKVNFAMVRQFNISHAAAVAGDYATFSTAYAEIERLVVTQTVQAILYYSYKVSETADATRLDHQAAAWSHWRMVAPYVASSSASASVATINAVLNPTNSTPPTDTYTQVRTALHAFYPTMGIALTDVGTLGAASQNISCPDPAFSSAPGPRSQPLLLPAVATLLLAVVSLLL